jgi:hypothetical protein
VKSHLVVRVGPDDYRVDLADNERRVLGVLLSDLRDLLLEGNDPSLRRLFPPAYGDDEQRNEEYQALAHDELLQRQLGGIDLMAHTLEQDSLDREQLGDWLRVENELRLVLGTQLDVTEDEGPAIGPDDPEGPRKHLYDYLGWLLDDIVKALSPDLESPGSGSDLA